ncbi:D-tyrosyl-tRNA(Tyr) deacylase [Rhodococcus sp. WMMA185]|uniref:D-aminoacyl-tRNA deacylase n=1 Tax=Rhodococcus sp. WMMA185 TaxID=679318 RepID=UPI00087848F8|nr:D-aminoacyl-tRNA deacylase [Rhodococcus sp. WMMA185]AOW92090.1 D-tyrosyl-tRNA(Tyr) deacylase [Rhodococcus sp. WMMA185]
MRALVQRVTTASIRVGDSEVARITPRDGGHGLLVLVGVTHSDDEAKAAMLAKKVWTLRILDDEQSAADQGAPLLVASQFTLMADTRRGRRPTWSAAAPGPVAEPLVGAFTAALRELGATVETGVFGEHMEISLINDGPVTLLIEV